MFSKVKIALFMFGLMIFSFSCQDKCFYYVNEEVHHEVTQSLDEIRNSFSVSEDFEIKKPGNIYTYGNLLLVGEKFEGIHILDNSNPSNPIRLKFIHLKGNGNFSISEGILLAENGPDILSININDLNNIKLSKRLSNVNTTFVRNDRFIVGYDVEIKKVKKECQSTNNGRMLMNDAMFASSTSTLQALAVGKGGSMSKFAIINDYLYIVSNNQLIPLNITNPEVPIVELKIGLNNNDVETLFPYKKYLYMGTASGVLIYNTEFNQKTPSYVATLRHVVGCDPVIVNNDLAYSTIRGGSTCRNANVNELNVYNVTNPNNAMRINTVEMLQPYGLGMKENTLFICQADQGLFVYNQDPSTKAITFQHSYEDIHAIDVIVNGNTLIVTADNGLFQFDITDPNNIRYLSELYHN